MRGSDNMKTIIIGDIHGRYERIKEIQKRERNAKYLQVGDLIGIDYHKVPKFRYPIYFIRGNHDNLNDEQLLELEKKNLYHLQQYQIIDKWRIGSVEGVYSFKRLFNLDLTINSKGVYFSFIHLKNLLSFRNKIDILL